MRPKIIAIILLVSFDCFSQSHEDTVAIDRVIKKQFYWYVRNLDSNSYKKYVWVKTNVEGRAVLDVQPYLKELKDQNIVTDNFINSEKQRTRGGNYFLAASKESETFEMDIHKQCDFVYFFFWLYSDRKLTEIKNGSYEMKRKKAIVNTILSGNGSTKELTISLIEEQGDWKIDSIAKK